MINKLKLNDLKVTSFVTDLSSTERQTINGGAGLTPPGAPSADAGCSLKCTQLNVNCFNSNEKFTYCCKLSLVYHQSCINTALYPDFNYSKVVVC